MRIISIVVPNSWYVVNFRFDLLRSLVQHGYLVYVFCDNKEFFDDIIETGAYPVHVPLGGRNFSFITEFLAFISLFLVFLKFRPSIVLSFNPKSNLYVGFLRNFFKFGWIANVSGLGNLWSQTRLRLGIFRWLFKISFLKVNHVFFQNLRDLSDFTNAGLVSANKASRQFGSGVDLNSFSFSSASGGDISVVCIARLLEKKGIKHFIRLAEACRCLGLEAKFILAGEIIPVKEGGVAESVISAAVSQGAIQYVGMLKDVRPLIRGKTVGCLLTNYNEGLPRSMIEFLAIGRPIIVSNFASAGDVVVEETNGLIVDLDSPSWLSNAVNFISKLEQDDQFYATSCSFSRSLAEEFFDNKVQIQEYLDLIGELSNIR